MENVLVDRAPMRLRRPARLLRVASDERLVALVRDGDEGAFEALYDRHHPAILGFCRHMLGTREEAEDAVQHTFLAAFRDLAGSEKAIELRPWLFAIARNRCLSLLRARRPHVAIELAEPASDGLAATVERREDVRELLSDLARLPDDQRAALLLAELGALDHAGIATVLGCPREKVKALVFQARASLAANREARATPCDEIRVELATATGAALRRGRLRRHLRTCDGCRAFKAEVATQSKLLALALPVVPSVALKGSILSGAFGASASGTGAAGAASATAGATSSASGGTVGVLGTVASTGAGKVAVSLAVAGAVAGGGTLTERLAHPSVPAPPPVSAAPVGASVLGAPASRGAASGQRAVSPPERRGPSAPGGAADLGAGTLAPHTPSATQTPATRVGTHGPGEQTPPAPAGGGASSHGTTPPGRQGAPPPGHAKTAPGQQGSTPPGHGGTPPGQSKTPPGQSNTPPGQQGSTPPGHGGTPPGQSKTPPGQSNTAPGQSKTPPGQSNTAPGQSNTPPGQSNTPPGQSDTPPGQSGASHGHKNH